MLLQAVERNILIMK